MEGLAVKHCDGCEQPLPDGAMKLCGGCAEKSGCIDELLAVTGSDAPVQCDGCSAEVDFDARLAVIVRGCGGDVLCAACTPPPEDAPS